jgi:general secretion pathway protein N
LSLVVVCAAALACAVAGWSLMTDLRGMSQADLPISAPAQPDGDAGGTPELEIELAIDPPPIDQFSEILDRPLFASSRRPPDRPAAAIEPAQPLTVVITGILITPAHRMALISPDKGQKARRIREGDTVQGWTVVSIEPRRVTFQRAGAERSLQPRIEQPQAAKSERTGRSQMHPGAMVNGEIADPQVTHPTQLQSVEKPKPVEKPKSVEKPER